MVPHWLRGRRPRPSAAGRTAPRTPFRLRVEPLEDRTTPATLHWTGGTSSSWSAIGNWAESAAPNSGDTLVFDTTTPGFAGTAAAFAPNNDLASLTGLTIQINDASSAGDFAIGGNNFGLPASAGTAIASNVSVGTAATISNPLTLNANTTFNVGLRTLTLSGVIGGGFSVTQASSPGATLTLGAQNTYSGGTTIASGTLVTGNDVSGSTTSLGTGPITLAGGILANPGGFTTMVNPFTVTAPSVIGGGGFFTLNGSGVLNATLTLTHNGFLTLNGALSGTGGLSEIGFPGGTTLGGTQANTFTGPVNIYSGGITLKKTAGVNALVAPVTIWNNSFTIDNDNQMNGNVAVTIYNGTLHTNGHSDTVQSLSGTGQIDTSGTATSTLTVAGGGNQLYTGTFTGAGALRYTGSGTLTLSGASSSFTGTLIEAGTGASVLSVNNDFSGATAQVTGGALGGGGVVKAITATGGLVSPAGPGPAGLLSTAASTTATTTLNGATFAVDLAFPIPLDQLVVGNGATINLTGATLGVAPVPGTPGPASSYTIVSSATGGITGTFNGLANNATLNVGGVTFRINYSANAVTLTNVAAATPTVLHWTGAVSSSWSNAGNWAESVVPTSGKSLVFDTTTVGFAGTAAAFAPNNDISGLTDITIGINDASSGGDFAVGGNPIGLRMTAGTAITSSVSVGTRATVTNPLTLNAQTGFASGEGTLTLGGVIGGAFQVVQASPPNGLVELNGANTYSGGTLIASGAIGANNNTALGSGPITLAGGTLTGSTAFITLNNPFTVTAPSVIGGGAFFTLAGNGVLNADVRTIGGQSFSGALSGPGGFTIVTFPGSTTFSGNQPNTFGGAVTVVFGGLNLQKTGGVTALASPITMLAPFTSLTLSADNQIADTVPVVLNPGGQFSLNSHTDAILSLTASISTSDKATVSTGTTSPPTPPNNLTVLGGGAQSYGGTVTGNGTLTYAGTGTLALHGASTSYTGTLVVSSGTLAVSADFSAATAQVTGGTLAGTGFVKSIVGTSGAVNPGGAGAGGVLSTAGGAVASALGGLTYQADLSDAGPSDELTAGTGASLSLAGASLGVNVLSSSNGKVFTIVTSPSGGITGTFNGLPNNATLSAGGRTFRINYTANAVTLTDVLGPTTFHWTGAAGSSWNTAGNWQEGSVPGSGTTLIFDTATPGFAGTAAAFAPNNNIAGLTGLALVVNDGSAAGDFAITGNSVGLASGGVTSTVSIGTNATVGLPLTLAGATSFTVNSGSPLVVAANVSGGGGIGFGGGGTLALDATNTYTGDTNLNAGTLVMGTNVTPLGTGTVFLNGTTASPVFLQGSVDTNLDNPTVVNGNGNTINGAAAINVHGSVTLNNTLTITDSFVVAFAGPGVVSGPGGIVVNSLTGTVQFGTQNTYTGTTTLTAGTLKAFVGSTATTGPFGNPASAVLALNGGSLQTASALTVGNAFTVGGPAEIGGSNNLTLTGNGTLTGTLTVNDTATTTFGGVLSGAGALEVNPIGGTVVLQGTAANTMTGTTTVFRGTLKLNKSAGVNAISGPLATAGGQDAKVTWLQSNQVKDSVRVTNQGDLDLNGFTDTVGSLASPNGGRVLMTVAGSALTVGADNTSTTYDGTLFGGGGLTKVGTGTLTLTGVSIGFLTSTTTVTAGTLAVDGFISDSPISLAGTLSGTGEVNAVNGSGGTIAPGRVGVIGTLTTAGASHLAGLTLLVDVNDPAASDKLAIDSSGTVTSTVDLTGGTLSVNVLGSAPGNVYTIVSSPTGGISGTFSGLANNATLTAAGRTFRVNYSANAVTLTDVTTGPTLNIADASTTVGTSGTTPLTFTVTLSSAATSAVTVDYATANGSAVSPGDYQATSGTLTFNPGQLSKTITVLANGNPQFNLPKTFTVILSNPSANATLGTGTATGTINYPTPAPSLSINNASATVGTTGTTPLTFTVTLSAASGAMTTVRYTTADGTAVSPTDYQATSGTLTFNPGQTTQTITVLANGTTQAGPSRQFTVVLSAPTNATISSGTGTGTINNPNSGPLLSIGDASATVGTSGTAPLTFTVTLSASSRATTTVQYSTVNGTAVSPADYAATSGTLTFDPGQTSKTITVTAFGTPRFNLPKQFTVVLSNPSNATLGTDTGTGTINYTAPAPSVSIGDVAATVGTGGTTPLTFVVALSAASGATTTVHYATADGTAVSPADYAATSGTLTFAPGQTAQTITVLANGTTQFSPPKSFTVVLSSPTNATVSDGTGVGTINNPNPAPSVSVGNAAVTVGTSGTTPLTFTVTMSAASSVTTTVSYATADGSAVSPGDYQATSGTLTFNPGQTTQTVTVMANGNPQFSPPKQFSLVLSSPTNATLGTGTGTGTINYPAPAPSLSIDSPSATVGTGGTTPLTFTVTMSAASNVTTTVHYATANGTAIAPADYTAASGNLTFAPGQTTQTITVSANGTPLFGPSKQFTVVLSAPTNATIGTGTGTGTINNPNPAPSLGIGDAAATVGTSGTTPLTFTVTLSAPSGVTTTVHYATADGTATAPANYAAAGGTLTFAPGQTTQTVTVMANGTPAFDLPRSFTVVLSSPTNATIAVGTATGTINNSNPAPSLGVNSVTAVQGTSGTSTVTFTVTLAGATAVPAAVDYATADGTAVAGTDYQATSGTLTFTPGQTTQTVPVTVLGNPAFQPSRTFTLNLSNPTNATLAAGQGVATLTGTPVAAAIAVVSGSGQSAAVGTPFAAPLVVVVTDQLGRPAAGVSVTFAGPGSGAGVFFPGGATAVTGPDGRAAVSVAANGAGGAYTVTATVAGVATPAVFPLTNTAPVPSPGRPLAVGGLLNGSAVVFAPNGSGQFNTTPAATVSPFGGLGVAVRTATGDFDGDGVQDTVMITARGAQTVMAVVSGKDGRILVPPTNPFGDTNFVAGGYVTAGDIDHDGRAEWVVTPELTGGPRVVIFHLLPNGTFDITSPGQPSLVANFFGIGDPAFRDGDRPALGDVNGDGILDVFSIAAFNGGPRTALYDGKDVLGARAAGRDPIKLVGDFFAALSGTDEGRGGRPVAAGDVNGDGVADLIVTGDNLLGAGNQVTIFSGADLLAGRVPGFGATPLANFAVGGQPGGALLSLAAVDVDGDGRADLAIGSGAGQPSLVKVYRGKDLSGAAAEPAAQSFDPFGGGAFEAVYVG